MMISLQIFCFLLLTQSLFSITKTGTHSFDHSNFVDTHYGLNPKIHPKIMKTFCILRNWNRFNAPVKHLLVKNFKTSIEEKKNNVMNNIFFSLKGNGILLPKLFWPTVRKIVLLIEKNFWNLRLNFWDQQNNSFKQWKVKTFFF